MQKQDERWMRLALEEARQAFAEEEVPVGCVVVHQGRLIGRGHNSVERLNDPTAHAETLAISAAATTLGTWRLTDCELFATLEPCTMCIGAIHLARISRLVFGASDPKFGACGSILDVPSETRWNHQVLVEGGVLAEESAQLMRDFFQRLRH
ncbi:MAG: tRNA adenosine(34) deaminase TadA [Candidatus Krumholzibacteria bacterium]|nr:tRNA adenosine(34) deaminase TadA [Candidatus Krumholzibacteria bacterium]MDP6669323.1 tRNA adenosine(34) deaminase TadA [Candidatus Krumholzibacteria bacterium]MDP6796762.1 tRNA adenosine(34) deaminase TadA [Candidatus Krumholzibacteria bacterium]MDP7021684.1 tRNA adenosine(34) deaminase TadA [Candidatus Krumholzibacteria bacterium]